MEQPKQLNPDHIINSMANRIGNLTIEIAQKDAVIIEQNQQIEDLKKDIENLRNELKEKAE